jgi:hypothetical protein
MQKKIRSRKQYLLRQNDYEEFDMKITLTLLACLFVLTFIRVTPSTNVDDNCPVYGCVDFAGNPRVSGKAIDIGAYEYQQPPTITKHINIDVSNKYNSFVLVALLLFAVLLLSMLWDWYASK